MNREIKYKIAVKLKDKPGHRMYYISTLGFSHKSQGYVCRKVQNHPYADKRGFMREHRLVMESKLGRFLTSKDAVHHINGVRDDNRLINLKLTSPIEHPRGHAGQRNKNGQFVAQEPIFQEIKFLLENKNTGEVRPYSLSELIGTTYRKGQFKFWGRFTDLLDKDGKEIYEGHKCKSRKYHDGHIEIGVVEFKEGCFMPKREGNPEEWMYLEYPPEWFEDCEIIGHIAEGEDPTPSSEPC